MIGTNKPFRLTTLLALTTLVGRARSDSLLRNSASIMGTTIATSLLGYLYWVIAAHTYSPQDVGLASALIAAMTLTSQLANLGIGSMLVQMLPRSRSDRDWSLMFTTALLVGALVGLAAGMIVAALLPVLSIQFAVVQHDQVYRIAFAIGVPLWTFAVLLDATFTAERVSHWMLLRNTAFAALKIPLLIAPLLLAQAGAIGILMSWVMATALALAAGLYLITRLGHHYRPVVRGMRGQLRAIRSSLAGHHFINVGGLAPMYLLPMFVAVRLSAADNAYFYTTWMLGGFFFMISPAVATSLFAEGVHAPGDLHRKTRLSAIFIGVLLGPAMLVFLLGGRFLLAIFGPDYAQHGLDLLTLLVLSAVPDAITSVYVSVLRVSGRLRAAAVLNLSMAAVALIIAWALLPSLDIAAVGWAWLIAQSAGSVGVGLDIAGRHWRRLSNACSQSNKPTSAV